MKKNLLKIISIILCISLLTGGMALCASAEGEESASGTAPFRISVTVNGDTATSRGICWYTAENTSSVVEISVSPSSFSEETSTPAIEYSEVTEWEGNFVHKAVVSGLTPGKRYSYRVGDGTTFSDYGTFVTDDGNSSFEFIAIADIQASSLENFEKGAKTIDAAFRTVPNAEFMFNLGDFTNDSTNEEWNLYDKAMSEINLSTTLAPITGNHDGLGVWHWFENMFNLDTSESVQTLNGVNYSFDYGNAHFSVLNTNDLLCVSNAQLSWLKNDLASTDRDWKIVFMHKSPYTLGKDGKWPDALYLQQALAKVLDEGNADIVFSGHDHLYLRTKKLRDNKPDESGTTYVLSGTAGSKRYQIRTFLADYFLDTSFIGALTVQKEGWANYWNGADWNSTKETNIGGCFSNITIENGTLTLDAYILADEKDENGKDVVTKIDSLTLKKDTGKNVPSCEKANKTDALDYAIGVVPSFLSLAEYTFFTWLPTFLRMLPELLRVYISEGTF